MSAHDRHLAQYRQETGIVECERCEKLFGVTVFSEYGQSWAEPEECPECNLSFDLDEVGQMERPDAD